MELQALLNDKTIKPKDKTTLISKIVLDKTVSIDDIISLSTKSKPPVRATLIESLEFATQTQPEVITVAGLDFVVKCLEENFPRVKWESGKVISNVIHLFPDRITDALNGLLKNTENTGTVVRWSAATAIGKILVLKTEINTTLIPAVQSICTREEKNSIKKIYQQALRKIGVKIP